MTDLIKDKGLSSSHRINTRGSEDFPGGITIKMKACDKIVQKGLPAKKEQCVAYGQEQLFHLIIIPEIPRAFEFQTDECAVYIRTGMETLSFYIKTK